MCSRVKYIDHVVRYIPRTYLAYNWKFVPFDSFIQFPLPAPTSGNHKSDLFFYEFVCLFLKYS